VSDAERHAAEELWEAMDGLPLALDQAGAYIEARQCRLIDYVDLYYSQRYILLQQRGEPLAVHPDAVATTWDLSFQRVEQKTPGAAELLRLCAFLSPEAIPEELITAGGVHFTSPVQDLAASSSLLNNAISTLRAYSLVQRDSEEQTLSIHRLVQAVLQDKLEKTEQCIWAERAVLAVNAAFPEVTHGTWPQCERLLSHALVCSTWIEHAQITNAKAAHLLNQTGYYLTQRVRYTEAEPLLKRALAISEQVLGTMHPDTALALNNLGELHHGQCQYGEAEPLYRRALAIREQVLGTTHPDTAQSLNNLGALSYRQGRYGEAELLLRHALEIREQVLGATHPDTASSLNNLGILYYQQGRYEEAEPLYLRTLAIWEQVSGTVHPDTALILNNLGVFYYDQKKYEEAEPLHRRALEIRKQVLGTTHPDTAQSLNNLGEIHRARGEYAEAESFYLDALAIWEQVLGAIHPDTAVALYNLGVLYQAQGKYTEAELFYQRSLTIFEQQFGIEHSNTQQVRQHYISLLRTMGCNEQANKLKTVCE
jgi:tetratricopeptide (TPR) repeat protein